MIVSVLVVTVGPDFLASTSNAASAYCKSRYIPFLSDGVFALLNTLDSDDSGTSAVTRFMRYPRELR